jgi:hypothetical protein
VVDKVAMGQVFPPSTSVFLSQFYSIGAPVHGKTKKLIIFITGLHNKPQGCGASVASAAGPFSTKNVSVWRGFVLFRGKIGVRARSLWGKTKVERQETW